MGSGHKCQGPKLFLIEDLKNGSEKEDMGQAHIEEKDLINLMDMNEKPKKEKLEISLNAIFGSPCPKTMRLLG